MSGPVPEPKGDAAVGAESPWLGLASFTEETRAYFHGRDDEVADLGRRVQRRLLTILFGQSGLGKTSMLRAGLVPQLRPEGYCPIYVRLDYSAGAPSPAEQIKEAVTRATQAAGSWSQPGAARPGESLWEFFHHRGDVLSDATGRVLTPFMIFDQFEEVFTLAQTDDGGRARATAFLNQLADLVENRPPQAIEDDEAAADRFDFSRTDYRVLLALREDYLAHLERLKDVMPSITQNRVGIGRMAGGPALEAVLRPGRDLVSDEVARQIVRFVSGARDLAAAEVEPSLLSLVCRELNEMRIARGEPAISADLLEGSRETILGEFYERSLADQPDGVRHFIEDVLLTDSGYRESIAEERVQKSFVALGAPDALRTLVDRRLLRIEERLDVRRVELTHDVLCRIVGAGRTARREREAREAAERRAAETESRETATKKALWRARKIAAACLLLAVAALGSAIFGYRNLQRARKAQAGEMAARASAQAEELIARQRAYGADMNVAMQALRGNSLGQAIDLLNRQRPQPGQTDLRGWEWRYVWDQTRSDAMATIYQGNRGEISSVAVSPDGRWLATGLLHGGGLIVWDLQTRQQVAVHDVGGYLLRTAFSPTEPLLAFVAADLDTKEKSRAPGIVHVWNAETRRMVWEGPLTDPCLGLSFSGDGKRLILTSAHELILREAVSGAILQSFPADQRSLPPATGFTVNPEGTMAAYGAMPDGMVRVVDLRDGHERWNLVASKEYVTALAFSPDGQTLATAAGFGESDIRLWDMTTGSEVGRLVGHAAWVSSIVFWPDGRKIASASADQTIRIWDVPSRKTIDVLRGSRDEVWRLALLPDGQTLVSGSKDGVVSLWDTSRPHFHAEHVAIPGRTAAWQFSKDTASLIAVDDTGNVWRWSGKDLQVKELLMSVNNGDAAAFRRDWFVLLSKHAQFLAVLSPSAAVQLWDVSKRTLVGQFQLATPTEYVVGISDDGSRLYTNSPNEDLDREWDVATQRVIQSWDPPPASGAGTLSPDGMSSIVLGQGGAVGLRHLRRQVTSKPDLDVLEASDVTYSPDARWLAAASQLGYVKIWTTADWKERASLRGFRIGTHSVAFSPDARRIAVGAGFGDEALTVWDTSSLQRVLTLSAEGSVFRSLQYSPDGNAIGVRNSDKQLFVWRAPTWEEISAAEQAITKPAPVNLKAQK